MLTEREIIIKIKNGEIDYFSFIVNKYTSLIYNYFKNKINKKEDIEDLVQEVFISFYKTIDRFDEKKPVKPYLYQIAKNRLKMFFRSQKPVFPLNEQIVAEEKEELNFDYSFLKILKRQEKEIFLLLTKGFSQKEIAKKLKKPINTVKSIIRRARLKIKQSYERP